jgi:hypothetical protein
MGRRYSRCMSVRSKASDAVFIAEGVAVLFQFMLVLVLAVVAIYAAVVALVIYLLVHLVRWIIRVHRRRAAQASAAQAVPAMAVPAAFQVERHAGRGRHAAMLESASLAVPQPTGLPASEPDWASMAPAPLAVPELQAAEEATVVEPDMPPVEPANAGASLPELVAVPTPTTSEPRNAHATTGFVLGIISGALTILWVPVAFSPLVAIPAMVFSIIGLVKSRRLGIGDSKGWTGLSLGAVAVAVWFVQAAIYLP